MSSIFFAFAGLQIDWEKRLEGNIGNDCLVSVDGTDCPYKTHFLNDGRPDKRFYCYKTRKSGLRYEVCISILSNNIVWISGPHLPGVKNDLQIFRQGLMHQLAPSERVEADMIYKAEAPLYVKVPDYPTPPGQEFMRNRVKKRMETINRRLKVFGSLTKTFTHSIEKHSMCFRTSAIVLQLALECGQQELFDCREYDDTLTDAQASVVWGV